MTIPTELRYTPHHLWAELLPDGTARAGITDHAQETLGDIVFIDLPMVGTGVSAGQSCGLVESVKTASDLFAPIAGTVVEINTELQSAPELVNEAPYAAWMFRIQPATSAEWEQLLDAEHYRSLLEQ